MLTNCLSLFILKAPVSNAAGGKLGDNHIQKFHLRRFIVGYTVEKLVLRRCTSGAVKHDFGPYASPNEKFEYGYPHSNALLQPRFK